MTFDEDPVQRARRERVCRSAAAKVRALALALPQTEERSHFGKPDFRVCGKIFGGLSQDEHQANLKLPPELQAALLESNPDTFSPAAGAWGRQGWTLVELASVEPLTLQPLLLEAWRLVAPAAVVAANARSDASERGARPPKNAAKASPRRVRK